MWVRTAWAMEDDGPWMVAAYDEMTFEAWGREPDFYTEDIKKHAEGKDVRYLVLHFPDETVEGLFQATSIDATTETP